MGDTWGTDLYSSCNADMNAAINIVQLDMDGEQD